MQPSELRQGGRKVGRQLGVERHVFARAWVHESKRLSVQRRPAQRLEQPPHRCLPACHIARPVSRHFQCCFNAFDIRYVPIWSPWCSLASSSCPGRVCGSQCVPRSAYGSLQVIATMCVRIKGITLKRYYCSCADRFPPAKMGTCLAPRLPAI